MKFSQETITIRDINTSIRQVTAWIGEGTGLAYVQTLHTNHELINDDTYNLIHVSSGYALPHLVSSSEEAQTYLEKVSRIFADRWNCDLVSLKRRFHHHRSRIMGLVELAHYDSLAPFVDFFLYAATEDEVLAESHTDASDQDPDHAGNLQIAEQLFSEYPSATKVIMARVADADGVHHILRTFERHAFPRENEDGCSAKRLPRAGFSSDAPLLCDGCKQIIYVDMSFHQISGNDRTCLIFCEPCNTRFQAVVQRQAEG